MPKIADRVAETTTSTGTGAVTLAGAKAGYRAFSAAFSVSDLVHYAIVGTTEWEVGTGTLGSGTLTRTTVLASSNSGSAVSFSAGTKDVFCTAPAALLDSLAALASPALTGTPTAPTASPGTNTTQLATTAFVLANAGGGGGAAAFTDLTDKTSADLPAINTPLAGALTTLAGSIAAKAPLASPTFTGTVAGITKSMVGLGSVDNTADTAKPVSTAQTAAFAVLGPYADTTALESAKPAASNGGRVAMVGAGPYAPYVSNGTAWLLFDNNSDPLVTVASSGSAVSQAATNLSVLNITLTANTTLGFTGIPTGTWSITLILRQDGTGSRLVTWPANTKWAAAAAPTLSTAASAVDVVTLMTIDAGTTWFGFLGGKGMA